MKKLALFAFAVALTMVGYKNNNQPAKTQPVENEAVVYLTKEQVTTTNDPTDLLSRIDKQHGTHTIEWAEKIGLGTRKYHIVNID